MVTNANDNTTYYLAELDETKIETRVIGKWIHAVQNQHEADPNAPALESNGDVSDE